MAAAAAAARSMMYARSRHLAKTFEGEEGMAPRVLHREGWNKPQLSLDIRDIAGAQVRRQTSRWAFVGLHMSPEPASTSTTTNTVNPSTAVKAKKRSY
jgi:hypothetical protein